MDFGFSPDEEKFKREVGDFFIKEEKLTAEQKKNWSLVRVMVPVAGKF